MGKSFIYDNDKITCPIENNSPCSLKTFISTAYNNRIGLLDMLLNGIQACDLVPR